MKILSNPQNLSVQRPNRSTQARAEKAEQPQDKVELNPQYRHEVRQGSITGALIGSEDKYTWSEVFETDRRDRPDILEP